jgi:hypothetical protein
MTETTTGLSALANVEKIPWNHTYTPMIATFLPGPHPNRTSGEYTVKPAHIIGAAISVAMFSGMGNVKYWCARICDA